MKIYKTLFWLSLIIGVIILSIGIYLLLTLQISQGLTAGRFGDINAGQVDGFSGIFLGVLILLLSVWLNKVYRDEKKRFDKYE